VRNNQLVRVLRLIDFLKTGRHSLSSLAQEFGVSQRTIRRDLEALSLAGVPVRNTTPTDFNGYWSVQS
jgi:predicted DNA-binding transcriptional regulator YafY